MNQLLRGATVQGQNTRIQVNVNVVHDLRSTVAAMRALANSYRAGVRVPGELSGALLTAIARIEALMGCLTTKDSAPQSSAHPLALGHLFRDIQTLQTTRSAVEFGCEFHVRLSHEAQTLSMDSLPISALELVRVIENLCLNAAQASRDAQPPGRSIVRLTAKLHEGKLQIHVADNGPGLPAELSTNPFAGRSVGKPGGSGLGLRFCKHTIERAGGSLQFRTSPKTGTTFSISLAVRSKQRHKKD